MVDDGDDCPVHGGHVPRAVLLLGDVGDVVYEPNHVGVAVGEDSEEAAGEVGGKDEDEDRGADTVHGAHGLEALPVLERVALGEELGGAHQPHHADELYCAHAVAAATDGADYDVEGHSQTTAICEGFYRL
jgi:hypothetical protein